MPDNSENTSVPATISQRATATIQHSGDILAMIGATVVKQVTRTVLQQVENVPFAVEFEGPAHESEVQTPARGGTKMQPARVADVINLVTGSRQVLIMNTVLEGEMDRNYPDQAYVGRKFAIRSHFPSDGEAPDGSTRKRRYKVYEIVEIEMPRDVTSADQVKIGEKVADGTDPVNRKGKPMKGD